ncbi:ribose-5-phosphate isomerase RpiA [Enterobacteriaceae endosymbiont of Donacia bicoloricornis]|uniref:ribose-5-phosphate isomerase RpiA n=1 Tax=Enterobacteriaceae endosymbiont of Donacia bicoloricornis TaxID=2675772 RepID=UPI001449A52E|nr:ribose-5-phosphate isomerase RpiA [Enterobacteriaceae endosymbiont of Donacia bicoloricornis]QJC37725.1 ribose-5-phosphate isomerase RpiA [Enterobacteriaceae endosymbiont of Donacia bicoloricornis]
MFNKLKILAAKSAIKYIKNHNIIGIGSGTTISNFIDLLYTEKKNIIGIVSASRSSTKKLQKYNFNIYQINKVKKIGIYFDSADEINHKMQMIKGGGAALTNEKIISSFSDLFICMIDESKYVKNLGILHPVPIEIIPLAEKFIIKQLSYLGAIVKKRINTITEHGNIILDVYNLNLCEPLKIEKYINNIPGVVTVGLFTQRCADIIIIGKHNNTVSIINKKI